MLQKSELGIIINTLYQTVAKASRYALQYRGKRNVSKEAGYALDPDYCDFKAKYERMGIAYQSVNVPIENTWRVLPVLVDGNVKGEYSYETKFTDKWNELTTLGSGWNNLLEVDDKDIWHYFKCVDIESNIGEYGLLILGFNDGLELNQSVKKGFSNQNPSDLIYMRPRSQGESYNSIYTVLEKNPNSARFGYPKLYSMSITSELGGVSVYEPMQVHWSRVIHVAAEGATTNDLLGVPALLPVLDDLDNLLKVTAAMGESAWRLMIKGWIVNGLQGAAPILNDTDPNSEEAKNIRDVFDRYINGLSRVLYLNGGNVQPDDGKIPDASNVVMSIYQSIAAGRGIPLHKLIGVQKGESLAASSSKQDEADFSKKIDTRRKRYIEPYILRPFINRMIYTGILPPPDNGFYSFQWGNLEQPTNESKSKVLNDISSSINNFTSALSSGISPLSKEEIRKIINNTGIDSIQLEDDSEKSNGKIDNIILNCDLIESDYICPNCNGELLLDNDTEIFLYCEKCTLTYHKSEIVLSNNDVTDFPKKGDNLKISLRNSRYKQFDYEYALKIKNDYPEIWSKGGNIRGNEAFQYWTKYRNGNITQGVLGWVKEREAWSARHFENKLIDGVVALIKWGTVGSIGESKMKKIMNEEKRKIDDK